MSCEIFNTSVTILDGSSEDPYAALLPAMRAFMERHEEFAQWLDSREVVAFGAAAIAIASCMGDGEIVAAVAGHISPRRSGAGNAFVLDDLWVRQDVDFRDAVLQLTTPLAQQHPCIAVRNDSPLMHAFTDSVGYDRPCYSELPWDTFRAQLEQDATTSTVQTARVNA